MAEQTPKQALEVVAGHPDADIDLRDNHALQAFTYGTVSRSTPEGLSAEEELALYETTEPVIAEPGVEERRTGDGDRVIISREPEGEVRNVGILPPNQFQ